MKISIVATSHTDFKADKKELDRFGGMAAGICYMPNNFETLRAEDEVKTFRRANMTKDSGHHSVYDHSNISLYMEGVPRVIECLLNNERYMVSSIKSGRYTVHALSGEEEEIYEKWRVKFQDLIAKEYKEKCPNFFTDTRVKKLAMENARYITGSFTLISMLHTVSYRQLNYIYGFLSNYLNVEVNNDFEKKLKPYVKEFLKQLESTGYIDEALTKDGKFRKVSLFNQNPVTEYFGDVYAVNFKCSFAIFLHLNRHRTLKYHIKSPVSPEKLEFYIPELIADNKELTKEWLSDLDKLKNNYPQAMLIEVSEMGNLEDFILKAIERKCSGVQLETTRVVNNVLGKYQKGLAEIGHNGADVLAGMQKGAKCTFPNYKCNMPCGFVEAINEKRKV